MKRYIIFIIAALSLLDIFAQEDYRINQESSNLQIEGTSNLHDWEMEVKKMNCNLKLKHTNSKYPEIETVKFSCHTKNITSDNSIMDSKAQKALKTKDHPIISFASSSIKLISKKNNVYKGKLNGIVEIAGESEILQLPFELNINNHKSIKAKGSFSLDMTDFGIKPPSALFGTLQTGNVVTVSYSFLFINF